MYPNYTCQPFTVSIISLHRTLPIRPEYSPFRSSNERLPSWAHSHVQPILANLKPFFTLQIILPDAFLVPSTHYRPFRPNTDIIQTSFHFLPLIPLLPENLLILCDHPRLPINIYCNPIATLAFLSYPLVATTLVSPQTVSLGVAVPPDSIYCAVCSDRDVFSTAGYFFEFVVAIAEDLSFLRNNPRVVLWINSNTYTIHLLRKPRLPSPPEQGITSRLSGSGKREDGTIRPNSNIAGLSFLSPPDDPVVTTAGRVLFGREELLHRLSYFRLKQAIVFWPLNRPLFPNRVRFTFPPNSKEERRPCHLPPLTFYFTPLPDTITLFPFIPI